MKDIYCQVCKIVTGKITTNRGCICWDCYNIEQKMFNNEDWRDAKIKEYAKKHDLNQREGETPKNLVNRCKKMLAENGFKFT